MSTCPACGAGVSATFRDPAVPVLCNVLCDTPAAARAVPRAPVELCGCAGCGLIFNAAFDPARIAYAADYENALHFSPTFGAYADELARELVQRYELRGKRVLDIGCGDGQFLARICELGDNTGVGCDPSLAGRTRPTSGSERVELTAESYAPVLAREPFDLICSRHVLEHIPDPLPFLAPLARRHDGHAAEAVVYLEVPSGDYLLARGAVWDVIYEHCLYPGAAALANLARRAGLTPLRVDHRYGDQFLSIEARAAATPATGVASIEPPAADPAAGLAGLEQALHEQVSTWRARLAARHAAGQRGALWGAGSKGVMFLNRVDPEGRFLTCAVDINPRKQGRCTAGSGHEIVAPEGLDGIDYVVLMNPLYREEVAATLERHGLAGELLALGAG